MEDADNAFDANDLMKNRKEDGDGTDDEKTLGCNETKIKSITPFELRDDKSLACKSDAISKQIDKAFNDHDMTGPQDNPIITDSTKSTVNNDPMLMTMMRLMQQMHQ